VYQELLHLNIWKDWKRSWY